MDSQLCCCSRQRIDLSVTKPRCRIKEATGCDKDESFNRVVVFCDCRRKALTLTSNTEKNPGRKFFKCPLYKNSKKSCGYFEWVDELFVVENEIFVSKKSGANEVGQLEHYHTNSNEDATTLK